MKRPVIAPGTPVPAANEHIRPGYTTQVSILQPAKVDRMAPWARRIHRVRRDLNPGDPHM